MAEPGSLVIVLGVAPACQDCGEPLPDGEGVAGEIIAGRQGVSCGPCASEGVAHHLFAVTVDDERAASAGDSGDWREAS